MTDPTTARAAQLLAACPASTQIDLDALVAAHAQTFPDLAGRHAARADLAGLISALADANIVQVPATAALWDRTATPRLPQWVRRVVTDRPTSRESPTRRLARAGLPMELVGYERMVAGQGRGGPRHDELDTLEVVAAWIRDTRGCEVRTLTRRERSVELFGRSKRINALTNTRLWSCGVLSDELLRTYRPRWPIPTTKVGDATAVLLVENKDTYATLTDVLTEEPGGVGHVAFGWGNHAPTLCEGLLDLPVRPSRVLYFGDVDAPGLTIGCQVTEALSGQVEVVPAAGLYRLLLRHGRLTNSPAVMPTAEERTQFRAWFGGGELAARIDDVVAQRGMVEQEALNGDVLRSSPEWRFRR